jgi:ring-1,2-phenylacetyl-CoA epoxidase subunit PaaE
MLQLKIEAIRHDAQDTATFFLSNANGTKVPYKAGQFITLVFNHHNEELRRSYSLSSTPDDDLLAITVKRVPNGELSRFLLTHSQVGDIWNAGEPAGRFTVNDFDGEKDLFFFAAGSGITPIFSQIRYLLNRPGKSRLVLIYSNRNTASILFKQELEELQEQHAQRLTIIHLLSDNIQRLNNVMTEQLVRKHARYNLQQARFYLCGPFSYMRMVRLTLIYMGVTADQIRKENFVLDTVAVGGPKTGFAPRKLQIIFGGETHDIVAGENQSILQAALQNHIPLPYSCRAGICSTCAVKCTRGKVTITENDVLTDADLAEGWVLTCTGYAITDDVVINLS